MYSVAEANFPSLSVAGLSTVLLLGYIFKSALVPYTLPAERDYCGQPTDITVGFATITEIPLHQLRLQQNYRQKFRLRPSR